MIKLIVLIFVVLSLILPNPKPKIVKGVVIFYFSKKSPDYHIDPPSMYCLDSLRFYEDGKIHAIKGDYLQNEHFEYRPGFKMDIASNIFRPLKLYCLNPMENYIHKGGEIYESEGDSSKLFIGFNLEGKAFHIIPHVNSEKNESIFKELSNSREIFLEDENCEYCPYFISCSDYYIFSEVLHTESLSEFQRNKFRLVKSKKTKFWRYGQW